MSVQHCKRCDKLFVKIKSPYCLECNEEIERQFKIIRNYIQSNPTSDISAILDETKVEEPVLLYLLREERLSATPLAEIPCRNCGRPIQCGKYCSDCTTKMTNDFTHLEAKMALDVKTNKTTRSTDNEFRIRNKETEINIRKR